MVLSRAKSSDKPLNIEDCCDNLTASLISIPDLCNLKTDKQENPQSAHQPCCCGQFIVSNPCSLPICEVSIGIEEGIDRPECCVTMPDGWTLTDEGPDGSLDESDVLLFENTSSDCSGAIGSSPMTFDVCGFQETLIKYRVTVTFCDVNGVTGACEPSSTTCSRDFLGEIECPPADVGSISITQPLNVSQGFPNPTSSMIQFNYSAPNSGLLTLSIVDVLGKTLSTTSRIISQGTGDVTLDISGAPTGNYYCVFGLNGEKLTKRIEVK